jgi:RNA polymerase sigma factor (sigma-70 family)
LQTDGQLLERYISSHDEEAFAEIVRRHGDMVLGVCRRTLRSTADDAAQATFVLLSRKAKGLTGKSSLAGWLLWSARLVCKECLRKETRRALREKEAPDMKTGQELNDKTRARLRGSIDDALSRLPEKYRDPVVLTYLEGRDRGKVAEELGLTPNALSVRLNRAMEKLRVRLATGGALSGGALVAFLSAETATGAGGAEAIIRAMATAGGLAAMGSAPAVALAKGAASAMTLAKVKLCVAVACAGAVLTGGGIIVTTLAAAETGKKPVAPSVKPPAVSKVEPALKADPAILKLIKNLGDNQSALLPQVKTHGNFNDFLKKKGMDKTGPRPRNYCLKWVWAPERKRALFCGGNAGVPHKLNDVWEYDLASNTWVLLWEPDPDTNRVRHMKKPGEAKAYLDKFVKLDEESGEIMTKRGAPFDPVHTWWSLTYDHELRALVWSMGNHHLHGLFLKEHPELKDKYKMQGHTMRLWVFYPHLKRWEFIKPPKGLLKGGDMEYIPELGGILAYSQTFGQLAVFHSKTKTWKWKRLAGGSLNRLRSQHPEYPDRGGVAAYDSANKILVFHHGGGTHRGKPVRHKTWHYDVKADKWEKVLETDKGPRGTNSEGPMVFDSVSKACFIVHNEGLWRYSVKTKTWTQITPKGPGLESRRCWMACYNPEYNVIMADNGGGKVWVYRAKKKASSPESVTTLAAAETGKKPVAPSVKPPAVSKVEPALRADPAILAILKGLGENRSALLPAVRTAGNMNNPEVKKYRMDKTGPRPRNYCLKWVWAADRKRALFCGGNAGVPHKLNDVWEYDLASNTWVLLWEPDPDTNRVRHMKKPGEAKAYLDKFVKLDEKSGEIMTRRGAPFDPVHTWWALTYDPELRALLWVQGNHHLHGLFLKEHPELKAKYKLGGYHKMRLFAYYPHLNKWEFMKYPKGLYKAAAAILDYIPELGGSLYYTGTHAQQGVFDSKAKEWKFKKLAGSSTRLRKEHPECPPREAVSAYDSANKVLVVHGGGGTRRGKPIPKKTYHYDATSKEWEKVSQSLEGPVGADNAAPMVYDTVAKSCLIIEKDALWSYRVADRKWTKLTPKGPALKSRRVFMACYNPKYNVTMADNGNGRIWVYRGKKRP